MNYLGVRFPLPATAVPLAKRELTVSVNGDSKVHLLPGDATASDEFIFAATDSFMVTLVDIDAHGNRSLPSEPLHGSIADEVRPPKPGPLPELTPANKRWMSEAEAKAAKEPAPKPVEKTPVEHKPEAKVEPEPAKSPAKK